MEENELRNRTTNRAKLRRNPFAGLEGGKLPPQATDLEEAVLGALMLEKDALTSVIDILKPECFYKEVHQKIFEGIIELFNQGKPVDILTVTQQLRQMGTLDFVGGPHYISTLSNRVASSAHTEFHAKIILQKHIARELIRISSETIEDAFEDTTDVFDLLDRAESNFFKIADGNIIKSYSKMSTLLKDAIGQIEIASSQSQEGYTGVPSGLLELDRLTHGWQKSDLMIIAARPAMGKTAFVLSMARNMAIDFKKPVAIFSLEMSSVQLVSRLISSETEIDFDKLRKGNLERHEWEQLHSRIARLSEAPIFIDDSPQLSIFELRAKSRRLAQQHQIQCIIVDYLQLMTVGNDTKNKGTREQEIGHISRSLKALAKELNVPVIALAQLSRNVEARTDKRPQLSDLRESGSIEQDADMVMFLHRPEYYNLMEDIAGNSTKGKATLIVAKNRHGKTEDLEFRFRKEVGRFENLYDLNDDMPYQGFGSSMQPNKEFSNETSPTVITRGSKMNDILDGDAPF